MLQIFTYSTGLALTGRSAACAPATATMPAAEPRRRLFTIFIVTSKVVMGGFRLDGCRNTQLEGSLIPSKPPGTPFRTLTSRPTRRSGKTGRPGDAPLRRRCHLTERGCTRNEEAPLRAAPVSVFIRLLHKWHEDHDAGNTRATARRKVNFCFFRHVVARCAGDALPARWPSPHEQARLLCTGRPPTQPSDAAAGIGVGGRGFA